MARQARIDAAENFRIVVAREVQQIPFVAPARLRPVDVIKAVALHGGVLVFSGYSSYVFWGSATPYFESPASLGNKIPDELARKILAYISGLSGVLVNGGQAAQILTEMVLEWLRPLTQEEAELLESVNLKQKIMKHPASAAQFVLAVLATTYLGEIAHAEGANIGVVATIMITNALPNYRGMKSFGGLLPFNRCTSTIYLALRKAQFYLAEYIENSFKELLEKNRAKITGVLDRAKSHGKVDDEDDSGKKHPLRFFLDLRNDDGFQENDEDDEFEEDDDNVDDKTDETGGRCSSVTAWLRSGFRMFFLVVFVLGIAVPQFGYDLEAYEAGNDMDSGFPFVGGALFILNAIVNLGLSLEAALVISDRILNWRRGSVPTHLNPRIERMFKYSLCVLGPLSGVTLAYANLGFMVDGVPTTNSTALIDSPEVLARAFEVGSFISDGGTNGYFALYYIYLLMGLYYRRSDDDFKQRLVKLEEAVNNITKLILTMKPDFFKKIVTDPGFPQKRLRKILKGKLSERQIRLIFQVGPEQRTLLGNDNEPADVARLTAGFKA